MDAKPQGFWDRVSETLFVRRADQTVIVVLVLGALLAVGVWWWRNGGASGQLVEHDQMPQREAALLVDVNTADATELAQLPQVGATLAERIIAHRRKHGPFRSFDDLKAVQGIGPKTLESIKPHVLFGN